VDDETVELLSYFRWDHLPERLQKVSRPFGVLAHEIVEVVGPGHQRTMSIEHLLIAKDAAVRAARP